MSWQIPEPVAARDRAVARLRDLTVVVGVAATALLGVFAVVAASTNPGRSDAAPSAGTTAGNENPSSEFGSDDSSGGLRLQRPDSGSFGSSSGSPVAVTGGSR